VTPRTLMPHSIAFSVELAESFGVPEAIVLQQIHYLCTAKNSIMRNGHVWAERSMRQWAADLKCFSVSTIERAIKSLVKQNLVVVDRHSAHKNLYRVEYVKLTEKYPQIEGPPSVKMKGSIIEIELETRDMNTKEATPLVEGKDLHMEIKKNGKGTPVKVPKRPSSSDSILAGLQRKNHDLPAIPPNTKESLKAIWYRQGQLNPDLAERMVPVLSMKAVKALTDIAGKWGPTSDQRLTAVLSNWTKFCIWLRNEKGFSKSWKTPPHPEAWFLFTYKDYAAIYADSQLQSIAPEKAAPEPKIKVTLPTPAPATVKQVTAEEKPATLEESQDLMKQYGLE
jgi:DNA-binding MarR family transcriptional regulator